MGIFSKKKDEFAPTIESASAAKPVVAAADEQETKKSAKKASKKSEEKAPVRGALAKEMGGNAYRILMTPVFTEKS
ncbi:MAG: hypothetical protein RLZZ324_475, partial [Candidatus Parcubacteria bacterium]